MEFPELDPPNLLNGLADASSWAIEDLKARINGSDLRSAIGMLNAAQSIHIVGKNQAFVLALSLAEGLRRQACGCHLLDPADADDLQWLHEMRNDDLLIAIHLPKCAWPVSALTSAARRRGISVLGMTDSPLSPVALHSDLHFAVPSPGYADIPPLAPYFVLIQSLLMGLQRYRTQESVP